MERAVRILGTGKYLPPTRLTAEEVDARLGLERGTLGRKSGVLERSIVAAGETTSKMGAAAARRALDAAGLEASEVDAIVSASAVPQQPIPCTAALVQRELGLSRVPCFDLNATCLSFVTALDHISYAIDAGRYRRVLLISSERASAGLNWNHIESAALFGDGAAAAVLGRSEPGQGSRILAADMETYSEGADHCAIRGGGTGLYPTNYSPETAEAFLFHMDGPRVFRMALEVAPAFLDRLLGSAGTRLGEVDLVIPHQASRSALTLLRRKLDIPEARWMDILADHGNCVAASIPMALHEAITRRRIQRGDRVLLCGTSAGFSIGGLLMEY